MQLAALALVVGVVVSSPRARGEEGTDASALETGAFSRLQRIEDETLRAAEDEDDRDEGTTSPVGEEDSDTVGGVVDAAGEADGAAEGTPVAEVEDESPTAGDGADVPKGEHEDEADRPPPPGGGERRGAKAPRDDGEDDTP